MFVDCDFFAIFARLTRERAKHYALCALGVRHQMVAE